MYRTGFFRHTLRCSLKGERVQIALLLSSPLRLVCALHPFPLLFLILYLCSCISICRRSCPLLRYSGRGSSPSTPNWAYSKGFCFALGANDVEVDASLCQDTIQASRTIEGCLAGWDHVWWILFVFFTFFCSHCMCGTRRMASYENSNLANSKKWSYRVNLILVTWVWLSFVFCVRFLCFF